MAYARTTTVDSGAAGDTVKQAILDCDTDITGIFANLNTHEALTATHGATGAVVGTTNTQTLTGKTLSAPTISGVVTLSSASLTGTLTLSNATMSVGTYTSPTLNTPTLTGTVTATSATITGGTYTNSVFVTTVSASTTDRAMTADDMCKVWTNTGASGAITFTLPEASTVLGKSVTFVVTEAQNLTIDPYDGTDRILSATAAAGDAFRGSGAGTIMELMAIGDDAWSATFRGTWEDIN